MLGTCYMRNILYHTIKLDLPSVVFNMYVHSSQCYLI